MHASSANLHLIITLFQSDSCVYIACTCSIMNSKQTAFFIVFFNCPCVVVFHEMLKHFLSENFVCHTLKLTLFLLLSDLLLEMC